MAFHILLAYISTRVYKQHPGTALSYISRVYTMLDKCSRTTLYHHTQADTERLLDLFASAWPADFDIQHTSLAVFSIPRVRSGGSYGIHYLLPHLLHNLLRVSAAPTKRVVRSPFLWNLIARSPVLCLPPQPALINIPLFIIVSRALLCVKFQPGIDEPSFGTGIGTTAFHKLGCMHKLTPNFKLDFT